MAHSVSRADREFRRQVESCQLPVGQFDHRAHVRLAYTYLVDNSVPESVKSMRETIIRLLEHVGIEPGDKYHETLTGAWILAVSHFMRATRRSVSADDFIEQNGRLLDSGIMMTHYSAELLFSEQARKSFVEPDLDAFPEGDT